LLAINFSQTSKKKSIIFNFLKGCHDEQLTSDATDYHLFADSLEETGHSFNDSFEYSMEGSTGSDLTQPASKPRAGSKWMPSLQLIKETAISAAAKGRERMAAAGNRPYSSSHVVMVKDEKEADL